MMKKIRNLNLTILSLGVIIGCTTSLSAKANQLVEADDRMVANCKFIASIDGSSAWGGMVAGVGIKNSKNEVLENAANSGATHIVWQNISAGGAPFASARAYVCK